MTDERLEAMLEAHGNSIVDCVIDGLRHGLQIERMALIWVHASFRGHDQIKAWVDEGNRHDLGHDGFICGMLRSDARIALLVEGLDTVAQTLEGDESKGGFALLILHDNEALLRHVAVDVTRVGRPMPMVKGGSA